MPLATSDAADDGRTCRFYLASFVRGRVGNLAAGRCVSGPRTAGGRFQSETVEKG
jgi:hypothetical protein